MEKYKIVVGTTEQKERAQHQYNLVSENDINANIKIYQTDGGELYSVEVGPYATRKPMLKDIDKIKGLGIPNAFITGE